VPVPTTTTALQDKVSKRGSDVMDPLLLTPKDHRQQTAHLHVDLGVHAGGVVVFRDRLGMRRQGLSDIQSAREGKRSGNYMSLRHPRFFCFSSSGM